MRLVRFRAEEKTTWGIHQGDRIEELSADCFGPLRSAAKFHDAGAVKLLAPCAPSKIVAVGLNYRDHAQEMGFSIPENPVLFLKPPTSVIGPGDAITYPSMSRQVDYEAELGIVIKDRTRNIAPAQARDHILGYTCANDVTARDLQKIDGQWTRAKSFDTFCPIGPWLETGIVPDDLAVESFLNGVRKQSSRTSQFVFPVNDLVSFISRVMTLEPGDLIITGTPAGIGPLQPGDEIEVRIEGIGSLKNIVVR